MNRILHTFLFILLLGCKSAVNVGLNVNLEKTDRSCDSFVNKLPLNFALEWQNDSIGDLGLRNKYLSLMDSSIVGLPFDCIQKYIGKSNSTFGNEQIYYCGYGKGSSEQLWIGIDNGLITSVSFVLE